MGVNMSIPAAFEDALTTNEQLEWLYKNKEALLQAGANIEISRQGDRTIITAKGEGFSPVVEVEEIPGGHQVTITDGEGPHTFYVMDGIDGTTPTVEVSSITGGYRLTITNGTVHESVNIMNGVDGADGADGDSIVVKSVESVEGGVNLTVTDKNGDHVIFLMNGPQGLTGPQGIQGIQGETGDTGATPIITANASVNNATGIPSVTVTKTGTDEYPNFSFAFQNLKGEKGDKGDTGTSGTDGSAATVTVGSTTTGQPGTSASVTNSGTTSAAILDFVIPAGVPGQPGQDGADGQDGESATITVGSTTTGAAGTSASVTNSGTESAAVLDFVIPKGDTGADGGEMIAEEYDPTSTTPIAVGDFRRYEGDLYKCINAIPTSAGDWDVTGFRRGGQIPDYDVTKNYPPISSSAVVYEGNVYIPTQYAVAGVTPEDTSVWAQQTVEHYDGSVLYYSDDTIFEVDGAFYVAYVPTNLTMVPLYPTGYDYLTKVATLSATGVYGPSGITSYMEYNGNLYQNNTGSVISQPASFDSEQWDDVTSQASEFSASGYYSVADLISNDGEYFYVTNKYVGRGSIGEFDPTDWVETLVGNEFKGIRQVPDTGENGSVLTKQGPGYMFMGKAVPGINPGDGGKVLTVNNSENGIYWATPSGGGSNEIIGAPVTTGSASAYTHCTMQDSNRTGGNFSQSFGGPAMNLKPGTQYSLVSTTPTVTEGYIFDMHLSFKGILAGSSDWVLGNTFYFNIDQENRFSQQITSPVWKVIDKNKTMQSLTDDELVILTNLSGGSGFLTYGTTVIPLSWSASYDATNHSILVTVKAHDSVTVPAGSTVMVVLG